MAFMMGTVMGCVLLLLGRHDGGKVRGMRWWGLAALTSALSAVFYALDVLFDPLVGIVMGNGLLMLGCALFYFGSRRFYGLAIGWRPWAVLGVLVLLWHIYFYAVQPDYRLRLLCFALALGALILAHARLLLQRGRGFSARFTALVLVLQTLVMLLRAISTFWLDTPETTRYMPSLAQSVYLAAYSFSVLFVSVGLLLMAGDRVRMELAHLANHDSLTGALTRRVLMDTGAQEFGRWQRYGDGLALLMLDVDHFKQINDRHGHASGDKVLQQLVAALGRELRVVDRLGRWGGEEFLVLMPQTAMAEARQAAERMRRTVAQRAATPELPACTISIGVAEARAGDTSLDAVLARADAALYQAKRLGRNRVEADAVV